MAAVARSPARRDQHDRPRRRLRRARRRKRRLSHDHAALLRRTRGDGAHAGHRRHADDQRQRPPDPRRPGFVSSTDYSEAASSPTIDAGTADPASGSLDLTDLPRTIGPATDIGATEFGGAAPAVTTGAASATGPNTATLTGAVAPEDRQTTWHFNYGTTPRTARQRPSRRSRATMAGQPVSAALSGLAPDTTYHFQLVAVNALGRASPAWTARSRPRQRRPPKDTTPPTVSSLKVSPSTFAVAKGRTATSAKAKRHHKGTKIEFKLNERAKVVIAFARKTHRDQGRQVVHRAQPQAPTRQGCTRYLPAGSLTRRSEPAAQSASRSPGGSAAKRSRTATTASR